MRRAIAVILILCMALSLAACKDIGSQGKESSTAEESSERHVQKPESSSEDPSSEEASVESSSEPESKPEESKPESSKPESSQQSKPEKEDSSADQGGMQDSSSKAEESSSKPEESSSKPEESSSKPEESSSKPEESSSKPEESSSKPEESSSKPEDESSQTAEGDDGSFNFPQCYGASDEETTYIIAQTIEAYLYVNDMNTSLDHLVHPVSYDWKTTPWYIEENKEIYFIQPTSDGSGENYIPSGINTAGYEYHLSDYFGWTGYCCGPWATENDFDVNYFIMSFSQDGSFFLNLGRMYGEFYGGVDGSYQLDLDKQQVTIRIIDGTDLVFDCRVFYKHIILIQRSEDGILSSDVPGTVYVLTMQEPQG